MKRIKVKMRVSGWKNNFYPLSESNHKKLNSIAKPGTHIKCVMFVDDDVAEDIIQALNGNNNISLEVSNTHGEGLW